MATEQGESTKVQEIVSLLKSDGVEAGKAEAERIVAEAREQAAAIVRKAEAEGERKVEDARKETDRLHAAAEANIRMAVSQGINLFKQATENTLLEPAVLERIRSELNPATVKSAVLTIVEAFARAGMTSNDLSIILGPEDAAALKSTLLKAVAGKLPEGAKVEVQQASISGGFVIKNRGGNLTVEVTEETIQEVLLSFLRSDFRKLFLGA